MNTPGFTAQASLYRSGNAYLATVGAASRPDAAVPQMQIGLDPWQQEYCRIACAYCRYFGQACFTCFYCAILIATGNERYP